MQKCTVFYFIFRMDSEARKAKLLIVGHSFVRRTSEACTSNAEYRYFCPDLLLSCMFDKVVFLVKGGLTLGGLFREFGAVCAEAPNVVLIDIGTNDLCNGCAPEELAEGIVLFAQKLTSIPSVLQVVICHILTRIPKSGSHYVVPNDFDQSRHIVSTRTAQLITDSNKINFWAHRELFLPKHFARDGVHIGMKRYVSSMRRAAIIAFKRCQHQV